MSLNPSDSTPATAESSPNNLTWKAVSSAAVILTLCGALCFGITLRNHVDQVSGVLEPATLTGLTASKDDSNKVDVPLVPYYDKVEEILKDRYVDPITDEQKLAIGAVRGMVTSLDDNNSRYMDKDQFAAFTALREGHYQGIGANLRTVYDSDAAGSPVVTSADDVSASPADSLRIPRLVVSSVSPGGAAAKAGVKPGDWVESIDTHWVINPSLIRKYRTLAAASAKGGTTSTAELLAVRKELREKADSAIMPARAMDRLILGTTGHVSVVWHRGDSLVTTELDKGSSDAPPIALDAQGVLHLSFVPDASKQLATILASKANDPKPLTIDLRDSAPGTYESMKSCLAELAPNGTYGGFTTEQKTNAADPLTITNGVAKKAPFTLLVDQSVTGPSQIFALALSSHGLAKLSGMEMLADRQRELVVALPDGSGYTLVTGTYSPMTKTGAKS